MTTTPTSPPDAVIAEPDGWLMIGEFATPDYPSLNFTPYKNVVALWRAAGAEVVALYRKQPVHQPTPDPARREAEPVVFWYRNYRGEEGYRHVIPKSIRFGVSEYHPDPQWLMLAFDTEKKADREFAMRDVKQVVGNAILALDAEGK